MTAPSDPVERVRLEVTGAVQGVGFRPFVYRLARAESLAGFVCNTGGGAAIEVEGARAALQRFLTRLDAEQVPPAAIDGRTMTPLAPQGDTPFVIAPSREAGIASALVLPDLATCALCLGELRDPGDRRYRYPFISCVHCGPRYSIIAALPYDRARTTMRHFAMCPACRAECADPASRRFHAEPNACPECGPQLALWDAGGRTMSTRHDALLEAVAALRDGRIVALKGLGGFQLLVDAGNERAVSELRRRKRRQGKPFALMLPTLAAAAAIAEIDALERRLLLAPAAPIVLLRATAAPPPGVAPGNPNLGIMLPATPLHHLVARELAGALVVTSGNRGDEPIVADEHEAVRRLAGIADLFLVHDRPILRPVDDSVVRVIAGRETVLRRARGYAPLRLPLRHVEHPLIALGGQQKSTVAIGFAGGVVLGPHVGDLGSPESRTAFAGMVAGLTTLHDLRPGVVACDAHPDYHTTREAERSGLPVVRVPHHLAHVLAGMVDNGIDGPVLGVAWDGTGFGGDGTIWGGEFLAVDERRFRRAAHLQPFRLPGGTAAMREPRRSAIGALHAAFGEGALGMAELGPVAAFAPAQRAVLRTMLERGVNAPLTTSAGRLFDAVAALLGLCQIASFEGEAAMAVEFAADGSAAAAALPPLSLREAAGKLIVDWRRFLAALVAARAAGTAVALLAAAFHERLAEAIVAVAERVGIARVVLTGGCFQNARLTEAAVTRLRRAGFAAFWHHRVPPNDGGLAVGQIAFAARPLIEERA
jgi:hydrogenase maturation protein HypF